METICNFACTDIVRMEWSHGRAHRLLLTQSAHTHVPTLEYLNSQLLAQKYKARLQHLPSSQCLPEGLWKAEDKDVEQPPRSEPAKTSKGGGSWRAFTSLRARGGGERPDWSVLAEEYRLAKDEHTPEYQAAVDLGRAASSRHREGHESRSSFGPYTRDVGRRQRERGPPTIAGMLTIALDQPMIEDAGTQQQESLMVVDIENKVSQLRSQLRRRSLEKASLKRSEQRKLDDLVVQRESLVLHTLAEQLPSWRPMLPSLHLRPTSDL